MKESLHRLLDLQEIDNEIDELMQSQNVFPQEIERLKGELQNAQEELKDKRGRTTDLEKSQRTLERDLDVITADLKKHQDRLYEVKSNREYDALQSEIQALQVRKEEHETAILETVETTEDLQARLEDDEKVHQEVVADRKTRIKELSGKLDSVDENVKSWEQKRGLIEDQIERRPLTYYKRIRRAMKGGVAVVLVKKGSCGGCFRQLSPQRLVEVRRLDQVIRCENCGRMLVWQQEEEVTA